MCGFDFANEMQNYHNLLDKYLYFGIIPIFVNNSDIHF
jgi:hypothetical protein